MSSIQRAMNETEEKMSKMAKRTMKELVKKWEKIFTEELVESNIHLLEDHVQTFFNEILSETERKEETILNKIESLLKEQVQLQRLLKVEKRIDSIPKYPLLTYQRELDKNLEDLREELQARKAQIKELLLKQEVLCNVLEEPQIKLYEDPLSTAEDIMFFKEHLVYLQNLKLERANTLSKLKSDIQALSCELGIPILEDPCHSLLHNSDSILSKYNIDLLTQLEHNLAEQKIKLASAISNLKKKLEILWECLEVDKSIRKQFNSYTKCSQTTYDILKEELIRCEGEKRRHIKVFVDRIRHEILTMWNQLLKSDDEREQFGAYTSECYNEDLLQLHEMELESLKQTFEENRKLLECFAKHQKLFDRMLALESTNPDRLQNRGGQLLREEQERKKINRDLPLIRQEIIDYAEEYAARNNGKPFLVYGQSIVDATNALYEQREERKQMIASNRKLNGTTIQRTPMSVKASGRKMNGTTTQRTPMSVNQTHLKRIGSSTMVGNDPKKYRTHLEVPTVKAQRGLFNDQKPGFVEPVPVVKKKKTTVIKAVISSLIVNRRQSQRMKKRKSKNSSKCSSVNVSKKKIPSAESSVLDYGDFQHVVSARKSSRSSEINDRRSPLRPRNANKSSRRPATPSQSHPQSPSRAGPSKLSTRNVPMLF